MLFITIDGGMPIHCATSFRADLVGTVFVDATALHLPLPNPLSSYF